MDARSALDALAADPELAGRCIYRETLAAHDARFAATTEPLHPDVAARLEARGIAQLYAHQAAGDRRAARGSERRRRDGHRVGEVALLPGADRVVSRRRTGATPRCCIFPTKALAQDQLRSLRSWLVPGLRAVTYDGDTAGDDRAWARKNANVVLTNPEMLHMGILPVAQAMGDVPDATALRRRRRAAHVARDLRVPRRARAAPAAARLRALRRRPTFCFASATIGNPGELASALCGLDVEQIDDDASPRAERVLACWQRPLLDEHSGARASANIETAELLSRFVRGGHQTLAFTRSRRGAEVVAQYARRRLARRGTRARGPRRARTAPVTCPRNGAALELELASGRLLGVAATNALELGIDVGGLDAVVLNGFPGTLASMWQQAGPGRAYRPAARSQCSSPATTSSTSGTRRIPTELTRRAPERAVVNPENPFVLQRAGRVRGARAARSRPTTSAGSGPGLDDAVRELVHADLLTPRAGKMYWSGDDPPAPRSACAAARRSSTGSSTSDEGTHDRHRRRRAASSPSRIRARCICTRAGSTASTRSTSSSTSRSSSRTTTPTSTPKPRTETDITIVREDAFAPLGDGDRAPRARSRCATRWSRTSASRSRPTA